MTDATLVLVHGAFHGGWCFDPVRPLLEAQGIATVAPDLPLDELDDDVAAVTAALDALDPDAGPVVLLGHSYGGTVVTQAGAHPVVSALVYLAAMVPDVGESTGSAAPDMATSAVVPALRRDDDGRTSVDPDRAVAIFYPDAEPGAAAACAARLRSGRSTSMATALTVAAWRERPTHYVICRDDPIVSEVTQRHLAQRAGATLHELPGDHSPFLARPDALADVLAGIVRDVVAAP